MVNNERLELALRRWWAMVAEEAAGQRPGSTSVLRRLAAVREAWAAADDQAHEVYLNAIERWLGEGRMCPICGTPELCEVSIEDPGRGPLLLVLEFEPAGVPA